MQDLLRRYGATLTGAFIFLTAFWLLALIILPNITLFESSFRPYLPVTEVGGPKDFYSFGNYRKFLANPVDSTLLGIPVTIEKVTDLAAIASYGVAATPGVVVDGRLMHAGGLPRTADIKKWLTAEPS